MQGWSLWMSPTKTDIHVMPVGDYRPHDFTRRCWCGAQADEENVVTHIALDGREKYEESPLQ
jgi:hypothetical protein